jgi:hypothetical protein
MPRLCLELKSFTLGCISFNRFTNSSFFEFFDSVFSGTVAGFWTCALEAAVEVLAVVAVLFCA